MIREYEFVFPFLILLLSIKWVCLRLFRWWIFKWWFSDSSTCTSLAGQVCFVFTIKKIKDFQPNGNITVIQQNWMKCERTNQCTVAFKLSHCFFLFLHFAVFVACQACSLSSMRFVVSIFFHSFFIFESFILRPLLTHF